MLNKFKGYTDIILISFVSFIFTLFYYNLFVMGEYKDYDHKNDIAVMPLQPKKEKKGNEGEKTQSQDLDIPLKKKVVINFTPDGLRGKKIFEMQGCKNCHYKNTGISVKPYPSKPHMISRTVEEFIHCVQNGVAGSSMAAFNLSKEEILYVRAYVKDVVDANA